MKILGINDQHNASACIVEDGVVTAAVQEERFSRIKNHFCFPHQAVRWVLEDTGADPDDLVAVALASEHILGAFTADDLVRSFDEMYRPSARLRRAAKRTPAMKVARRRRRDQRLAEVARAGLPRDRAVFVEHHTAHAAAAFHGAPWKDEPVLVLTADGHGDGLSASVRIGSAGSTHDPLATVSAADSLGSIYATVTGLMGMVPLEHEYKLMGLAPYAPEKGADRSYEAFAGALRFDDSGLGWHRTAGVATDLSYRYWRNRLERHRFDWIAAGLQRFTEEHLIQWVRNAVAATGVRRVALGGGVFMNVKANQRLYQLADVDDLFVFPSCGDETNAIGAAFEVYAERAAASAVPALGPLYWGPDIHDSAVEPLVADLRADGYRVEHRPDRIDADVAELLAAGEVVARARGRMEFGARALGNRSILADPTRPDVIRIINDMIKSRDFWMPFAPAVMGEEADTYLVNPRKLPAPYMIMAFDTTDRSADIAAALHPYDRTVRPQVVTPDHNSEFHALIARFRSLTGRGAILNTSFNLHGHPIVCSAADAVAVLRGSDLRHLAVANYLISRPR